MTIAEIMASVQYVVNSQGEQTAVQFNLSTWEALRQLLEDKEDSIDLQQARQEEDTLFDWEQVVAEHQAHYNVQN